MNEPYCKLACSILDSSIWSADDSTRIVWITMLAMKGADGIVRASVSGVARRARKSVQDTQRAIDIFLAPDPDSKNPDHEGRKIERVDGGWMVLNHEFYRNMFSQQETREYEAHRKAEQRARKKEMSRTVPDSPGLSRNVPQSDQIRSDQITVLPSLPSTPEKLSAEIAWGWAQKANTNGGDYTMQEVRHAFFTLQERGWSNAKGRVTQDHRASLFRQIEFDRQDREEKKSGQARRGTTVERPLNDRSQAVDSSFNTSSSTIYRRRVFKKPTIEEVKLFGVKSGLPESEAIKFWNFYESKGWKVGKVPMVSLNGAIGGWASRWRESNGGGTQPKVSRPIPKGMTRDEAIVAFCKGEIDEEPT